MHSPNEPENSYSSGILSHEYARHEPVSSQLTVLPRSTTSYSPSVHVSGSSQKQVFIENVKRWVLLDTHLKKINEKTKTMREERQDLSGDICKYLEENQMANKRIGIHDGDLRVYQKKEYTPLSFGYLEERLGEIMPDKSYVDYIMKYLKEHRETTQSNDLKRTYGKKPIV